MTKISDISAGIFLTVFCLGWLNIFGAQYTWWALMKYLAN